MLARALLSAFVGTAQVQLPLLGIAPPSWKWGTNEVLIDLGHHLVYAVATVGGWILVGVAVS
jgi:hypothetical protein